MSTFIADLLEAEDALFTVIHGVVVDSVPSIYPSEPEVFYIGIDKEDDESLPDVDGPWLRVSYRMSDAGQSTLSQQGHQKRWTRRGTLFVQLFSPLKDPTTLKKNKQLAILAQRAYEAAGSQCGMIFRNVLVTPVGPSEAWYQINMTARFEYEEFH